MSTELARARTHLRQMQRNLREAREAGFPDETLRLRFESRVLAALSWLWDVQQRYGVPNYSRDYSRAFGGPYAIQITKSGAGYLYATSGGDK